MSALASSGEAQLAKPTTLSVDELVKLGAVDTELYCRAFFPKTFRQDSPPFSRALWDPLEDPTKRLVNILCFRDSSKTTRLRAFASKRVAYGISRTILYIGATEGDAIHSLQWLRTQVEKNTFWAGTFKLSKGRKWQETEIEIIHSGFVKPATSSGAAVEPHTIWITVAGINGSLRGINFDDYRPDLIVVDDPQTDETAATEEQRNKVADLIMGAVKNSLAPVTEEPNAKMVMAITPQHKDDISQRALKDEEWTSRVFPCWTKETIDLPVEKQMSSWEARHPSIALRNEKRLALKRNKLSIFLREKECRITSPELSTFRPRWLNIREPGIRPRGTFNVLAIDPVPPPSDRQLAKGLQGKDYETHYVWGRLNNADAGTEYHLLDFDRSRGHDPSWTCATAFRLARMYRVARIIVDAVAYQRTLKWILEQEMKKRGEWYSVVPIADGMKKFARIENVFNGLASSGQIFIGPEHIIFAEQFEAFGPTYSGVDDDLDASALAVQDISNPFLARLDESGSDLDISNVEDFPWQRLSP